MDASFEATVLRSCTGLARILRSFAGRTSESSTQFRRAGRPRALRSSAVRRIAGPANSLARDICFEIVLAGNSDCLCQTWNGGDL